MTTPYGRYGTKKPSSGTKTKKTSGGVSGDIANSAMPKFLVKLLLDMPFIKRNIGKKPLLLHLSLKKLRGRLVVNIPTPPTDRIW